MSRTIVHLDADAFFASVEQAADTRLRGKPMAVGGESRGIIASASYEARKFGVYTPMPTARARKLCPKLIVLPGDYERYEQFSNWMFGYAYDFTPDVEQTSIDEGYFDLTANRKKPADRNRADHPQGHPAIAENHRQRRHRLEQTGQPDCFQAEQARRVSKRAGGTGEAVPASAAESLAAGHRAEDRRAVERGGAWPTSGTSPPRRWSCWNCCWAARRATIRQFANGIDERPLIPAREPQKSFSQQETFAED